MPSTRVYTIIHVYEVLEWAKLISAGKNITTVVVSENEDRN